MKNKIKNKKKYLWLFLLLPAAVGFFVAQAGTTSTFDFTNFAWIGNNLQSNQSQGKTEVGDPVIGMVGTKGAKYKLTMSGDENNKLLNGYAWLGIGTENDKYKNFTDGQSDLPTLGWIGFNQNTPPSNCFGMGDCYPVRWSKKPGGTSPEGYLSGWAKMFLGKDGSGTNYPETWVHFRSPSSINYDCDGKNNYFVCSDKTGKMNGYAWSAGADSVFVEDNPGLGWINFSEIVLNPTNCDPYNDPNCCGKDDVCNTLCKEGLDSDCGVVPAGNAYCSIVFKDEASKNKQTTKNICASQAAVNLEAYVSGLNLIAGDQYEWTCKQGDTPILSMGAISCNYGQTGNYYPTLRILDKDGKERINCTTQNSRVSLSEAKSCEVLVRKLGSADPYEKNLKMSLDEKVETIIGKTCIEKGDVVWTTEAVKSKDSGEKAIFEFTNAGSKTIGASIGGVPCSSANLDIKDKLNWR